MHHFRLTLGGAAVCALLATAGCSDDGDTINNTTTVAGTALPGNYPGAPETAHYTASDGNGMSEPSHVPTPIVSFGTTTPLSNGLRWFPSGVGGKGITLYLTSNGGQFSLWAQYYDGSRFTKAVALLGANQNTIIAPFLSEAQVLFLNTTGTTNGDAMIFWRSIDQNTTTATERLYYSYFDASLATTGVSATDPDVRWGFDTTGAAIDQGAAIADVTCLAVVSDGLRGEATFLGDIAAPIGSGPQTGNHFNVNFYQQGDATSFAGISYIQPASVGGPARLHYRMLNVTTGVLGGNSSIPMPATANGATDFVLDILKVYNGSIFFTAIDAGNNETESCWSAYGTTGAPSAFMNTTVTLNPSSAFNHDAGQAEGLFGPDEGLVNLVGRMQVKNLGAATNIDLFAFQVDPATGAFNSANDRVEIDRDVSPTNANQPVTDDDAESVLNRTGDLMVVAWTQQRGNTNSSDDGAALWARGIQLTRTGTAPALSVRVTPQALQVDGVTADTVSANDTVTQFKFQNDVNYRGTQSDRYTMHLLWQQDETSGAGNDQCRSKSLTFTPSTSASTQPVQFASGTEDTVVFGDGELGQDATNAAPSGSAGPGGWDAIWGVDAGGSGGSNFTGGLALFYVRDTSAGPTPSYEAFLRRQTGATSSTTTQIGSIGSGGTAQAITTFGGVSPSNTDTTNNPNWAGDGIHVLITEQRVGNQPLGTGSTTIRHRYFDKTSGTVDASRFTPQVTSGSPPAEMDSGAPGNATLAAAGGNGSIVATWFTHGGHLWYQQWNPASRTWIQSSGAAAPELVDHGSSSAITVGSAPQILIATNANNGVDEISKTMVFFRKGDTGNNRWYARPRD